MNFIVASCFTGSRMWLCSLNSTVYLKCLCGVWSHIEEKETFYSVLWPIWCHFATAEYLRLKAFAIYSWFFFFFCYQWYCSILVRFWYVCMYNPALKVYFLPNKGSKNDPCIFFSNHYNTITFFLNENFIHYHSQLKYTPWFGSMNVSHQFY